MGDIIPTGKTTREAKADLNKLLAKVRGLLDYAAAEEARAEAEKRDDLRDAYRQAAANYRERAEQIMRDYRIAEEHLIAADPVAAEPVMEDITLAPQASEFYQRYLDIFHAAASHCGVRARYIWVQSQLTAQVVGYEGDIRYANYIFTNARMVFAEHLEPEVMPGMTEAENIYRLRAAGIDRQRIAELVWGKRGQREGEKVSTIYQKVCAERGEDAKVVGRSVSIKTFREVYGREFVSKLRGMLWEARNGADSAGGALVLHGRQERVGEAFYARFPEYRPSTEVAERKPCEKCAKTKHASGKCPDHRPSKVTKADLARHERLYYSPSAEAGRAAGREAASEVEIDRSTRAKRLENPVRWSDIN